MGCLRVCRLRRQNFQPRIHFTQSDYMILTQEGRVCDSDGKLGRAEFEACLREQINFYAQRKLSDCLLNESFSDSTVAQIGATKLMLHELLRLSDYGRAAVGDGGCGHFDVRADLSALRQELQIVRVELGNIFKLLRFGSPSLSSCPPSCPGTAPFPSDKSRAKSVVLDSSTHPLLPRVATCTTQMTAAPQRIRSVLRNARGGGSAKRFVDSSCVSATDGNHSYPDSVSVSTSGVGIFRVDPQPASVLVETGAISQSLEVSVSNSCPRILLPREEPPICCNYLSDSSLFPRIRPHSCVSAGWHNAHRCLKKFQCSSDNGNDVFVTKSASELPRTVTRRLCSVLNPHCHGVDCMPSPELAKFRSPLIMMSRRAATVRKLRRNARPEVGEMVQRYLGDIPCLRRSFSFIQDSGPVAKEVIMQKMELSSKIQVEAFGKDSEGYGENGYFFLP